MNILGAMLKAQKTTLMAQSSFQLNGLKKKLLTWISYLAALAATVTNNKLDMTQTND